MKQRLLAEELELLESNGAEFAEQHPNLYLLVKGSKLVGAFRTQSEAIAEGSRLFGEGPFLVRLAGTGQPVFTVPALALGILQGDLRADSQHKVQRGNAGWAPGS